MRASSARLMVSIAKLLPAFAVRLRSWMIVLAVLLGTGLALEPLARPVWHRLTRDRTALHGAGLATGLGQAIGPGLLGGCRALAADLVWLRAYAAWESSDLAATRTLLELATAADPRPLVFWLNGARIIGYDMAEWRIAAAGGRAAVPAVVQRRIEEDQARRAIAYLENGLAQHPQHPLLYLEIAHLHLHRRNDVAAAAGFYQLAARQPGAPFYAARIYGELLKKLGRHREAYFWLVTLYPTLPVDNERAMAAVVLGRIRELEDRLAVPPAQRYQPAAP